jgi:hypothetical protein
VAGRAANAARGGGAPNGLGRQQEKRSAQCEYDLCSANAAAHERVEFAGAQQTQSPLVVEERRDSERQAGGEQQRPRDTCGRIDIGERRIVR